MQQYLNLVQRILAEGEMVKTRNGNRLTIYGAQLRFDLRRGFPLLTTKKLNFNYIMGELAWFLRGQTDTKLLHEWGIPIWDANADENGQLGPVYGYQWRNFDGAGYDQIGESLAMLRKSPASTRNVVTAWNPLQMPLMKLPPCHFAFQVHSTKTAVTLQASQRSVDTLLGLPFNIASYAILTHIYANLAGREAKELIMDLGNVHIYEEHIPNALVQLGREPKSLPKLRQMLPVSDNLMDLYPESFVVEGYDPHPFIKYAIKA